MDERKRREVEKLCSESDELKSLQDKIKAAYLNKERNQQITEKQYRDQDDIEQDAAIDMVMLKNKEINDINERKSNQAKLE
jgi:phosphoserine phosphatase